MNNLTYQANGALKWKFSNHFLVTLIYPGGKAGQRCHCHIFSRRHRLWGRRERWRFHFVYTINRLFCQKGAEQFFYLFQRWWCRSRHHLLWGRRERPRFHSVYTVNRLFCQKGAEQFFFLFQRWWCRSRRHRHEVKENVHVSTPSIP